MKSDENSVRLFALNCAVLQSELQEHIDRQSVTRKRSELEIYTDRLTEPYLKQIDLEIKQNAARMSEYYEIFYALENYIRVFVKETLEDADGEDWWANLVPPAIHQSVQELIKKELKEGIRRRSDEKLDYTTFGELGQIIIKNWNIFGGLFSSSNQEGVTKVFYKLNMARGPIAHCGILSEDEVIRLKLTVKD